MLGEDAFALRNRSVRTLELPDHLATAKAKNLMEMLAASRDDYEQNFSDSSSEIADPFLSVHDSTYYRQITKKFLITEDSSDSACKASCEDSIESIKKNVEDFLKAQCNDFKEEVEVIERIKNALMPTRRPCDPPAIPCERLWCSSESVKLCRQPVPPGLRILLREEPPYVDEDDVDAMAWRRHDANVRKCQKWLDENIEKMLEGV